LWSHDVRRFASETSLEDYARDHYPLVLVNLLDGMEKLQEIATCLVLPYSRASDMMRDMLQKVGADRAAMIAFADQSVNASLSLEDLELVVNLAQAMPPGSWAVNRRSCPAYNEMVWRFGDHLARQAHENRLASTGHARKSEELLRILRQRLDQLYTCEGGTFLVGSHRLLLGKPDEVTSPSRQPGFVRDPLTKFLVEAVFDDSIVPLEQRNRILEYQVFERSGLVDVNYYLGRLRKAGWVIVDERPEILLSHFAQFGQYELIPPRKGFDPRWYARRYSHIGQTPARHYVLDGRTQGYLAGPSDRYPAGFRLALWKTGPDVVQRLKSGTAAALIERFCRRVELGERDNAMAMYPSVQAALLAVDSVYLRVRGMHNLAMFNLNWSGSPERAGWQFREAALEATTLVDDCYRETAAELYWRSRFHEALAAFRCGRTDIASRLVAQLTLPAEQPFVPPQWISDRMPEIGM
jgi:hypothetical protein